MAFSTWRPMTQAEVERVPACPGVFELATLVRTVVFIGAATESLGGALEQQLALTGPVGPRIPTGRLYFRYHATEEAEQLQRDLLAEYRHRHDGASPPGQSLASAAPHPRRHLKAV